MIQSRRCAQILLTVAALSLQACAETSWEAARRADTVGAYNQFLRDNPSSAYAADAKERMAYLRVKTYRTIEVYEEFRRQHPRSALTEELHALIEPLYFDRARAANTMGAYEDFIASYPKGSLTPRAIGNLSYVRDVRDTATLDALEEFVAAHPSSDFVAEAKGTIELTARSTSTQIRRLGVRVEIAPNVVQSDRVARGFAALIAKAYAEHGIPVRLLRAEEQPGGDIDAWVRVDYREASGAATIGGASLYSYCRIRLYHLDNEDPIWDRSFEAPAEHLSKGAYGRDKTVFGNSKYAFWKNFFVPVSTWAVSDARVNTLTYLESVRSIDIHGDSAALLLERGGIDFLDISSPAGVAIAERYRREIDLADWRGVRMLRDDLAITFGNDGAELIRRGDQQARRVERWDAGQLGAVHSAELFDDATLLIAGTRGLHAVRLNRAPLLPQPLLDGDIVGLEVVGDLVYVIRPRTIEIAQPKHLLIHVTARRIPFADGFRAERARRVGDRLLVFGGDAVAEVSIRNPARPALVATIARSQVGEVADMAADSRYRYILGERGLQIADSNGTGVEDYIQVNADRALAMKGRFALLVGRTTLEVFDLAPYRNGAIAAHASRLARPRTPTGPLPANAADTDESATPTPPPAAAGADAPSTTDALDESAPEGNGSGAGAGGDDLDGSSDDGASPDNAERD